ncbi:hypothetical protein ABN028_26135 [Actinopolymorpha sp. B17G11]|uniref:hypothetical protein n=1 Tax=Actinopolymorpha sp. B17G11 TaxID=3160861 RepID=UPI0032E386AB
MTTSSLTLKIGPGDTAPDAGNLGATYDQVIATVPVRDVPYPWVQLVRPGGELVVTWHNPFAGAAIARLSVAADGRAAGNFVELADVACEDEPTPVIAEAENAVPWYRTTTPLDPDTVWSDPAALFALGVRLPRLRSVGQRTGPQRLPRADQAQKDMTPRPDGTEAESRRWVYDGTSCACAVRGPSGEIQVEQHGPRLLWREIEAAYKWWLDHDQPAFDSFGLSVTSFGQFAWLGHRCSGRIWRL